MTTFISITNEDVYKKLLEIEKTSMETLSHAKITNGRVTTLERRSLGMWISRHPFKFTAFILVLISFLVSDIRHPLVSLVAQAFL